MTGLDVEDLAAEVDRRLARADDELRRRCSAPAAGRQPVHTCYVPADVYHAGLVADWGAQALAALDRQCPDGAGLADRFADLFGVPRELADDVHRLVREKLVREPVEDLRVDFEDGYGDRGDAVEDADATRAAVALAASVATGAAAPFSGLRCKGLEPPTRRRALRTLDVFVRELTAADGLWDGFVVTLPKVTSVDQVEAMVVVCDRLERAYGLAAGTVRFELQVETPQAVLGPDGTAVVARMLPASAGRCTGLHYGTYDYSAACGVAGAYQSLEHPVADHAKAVMQVAAAGTGVRLSDGSTNVLPVGSDAKVRTGWRLHSRLVRRSLERGFYAGWDLHPAQLPSRYAATYAFYRELLPDAAARLRDYAGGTGARVLDEPATARALSDSLVRGIDCGALDPTDVTALTGVDVRSWAGGGR